MNEIITKLAIKAAANGSVDLVKFGVKSIGEFLDGKSIEREKRREEELQRRMNTFVCARCGEDADPGSKCCPACGTEKTVSLHEVDQLKEKELGRDKDVARLRKHAKRHFRELEKEYLKTLTQVETVRCCMNCYVQLHENVIFCPTCGETTSPLSAEMTITLVGQELPWSSEIHGTFERGV